MQKKYILHASVSLLLVLSIAYRKEELNEKFLLEDGRNKKIIY